MKLFLALNSPGGSAVQSSLIAGRIRRLAEEKKVPVIACVEDAAASGGYWIACAADEIVADPASILGSIGVIAAGFGFTGAMERLGVERRLRTAGGEKSFWDPFRHEQPEDVARLDTLLQELHQEFRDWVLSRRAEKLKVPAEALFTGRFWPGRKAVELGLADRLGDALGEAKRRFGPKAKLLPIGGPGASERLLVRVALEWASVAPAPATDRLFEMPAPSAWIAVQAGGPNALVDRLMRESHVPGLLLDTDAPADDPFRAARHSAAPAATAASKYCASASLCVSCAASYADRPCVVT